MTARTEQPSAAHAHNRNRESHKGTLQEVHS